ncbi:MAG: hypothetical protein E3J37_03380 [Anaerolineales bacterium]|nr:MAG: hypothetical protein E3J37_03380 [Anaerolineales bacterium]
MEMLNAGLEQAHIISGLREQLHQLKAENERLLKALNLIAVRGEGQDASNFDNCWYSEYAYATAEKALRVEIEEDTSVVANDSAEK